MRWCLDLHAFAMYYMYEAPHHTAYKELSALTRSNSPEYMIMYGRLTEDNSNKNNNSKNAHGILAICHVPCSFARSPKNTAVTVAHSAMIACGRIGAVRPKAEQARRSEQHYMEPKWSDGDHHRQLQRPPRILINRTAAAEAGTQKYTLEHGMPSYTSEWYK